MRAKAIPSPLPDVLLAAAGSLTLSACGGGGGGEAAPGPAPPPTNSPPPAPPISEVEAARFLLQSQFAAPDADIATLRAQGYDAWLNASYAAAPGQTGAAWLTSRNHDAITAAMTYFLSMAGDHMIWNQLLTGPDQMRKRVALALSEYFVVSLNAIDGFHPAYVIAAYWDLLTASAFGNFRTLLEKVTLNLAMGMYLNTKGNLKEDLTTGRQPDENYAREVMQLFTIGLYELNTDGTAKTDTAGNPIETYKQSDISNLARVFTGYDIDFSRVRWAPVTWHDYPVPGTEFASDPMRLNPANHSTLEVRFLGATIPANTSGADALRLALDIIFRHPNVGPFFARQMIQRLVTSNPSPAYVGRVAQAFANNGAGVRGDLKAVWTAILTDAEARAAPDATQTTRGKLREPIVRLVQWARTVGTTSATGAYELYDLTPNDFGIGQSPLRAPSVFNFFRPGYVPPNTGIAAAARQAPEFQLHNETTTAGYINFMEWMTSGAYQDVLPGYAALLPLAHDPPALLAWLNLRLAANQVSAATLSRMQVALTTLEVTANSTEAAKKSLAAYACLLILACPEYLIQK